MLAGSWEGVEIVAHFVCALCAMSARSNDVGSSRWLTR
jgi:hypothetical protein